MFPTAGRHRHHQERRRTRTGMRGSPLAVLGAVAAVCALALGLTSCGGAARAGGSAQAADVASWSSAPAGAQAVERQADAQQAAAAEAARVDAAAAAERAAAVESGGQTAAAGPDQCTTRPEDRAACTMPEGARITPDGGDVDGDGVFEKHEPVGPAYKDPRAYDGGATSGESQCAWARQQGYGC